MLVVLIVLLPLQWTWAAAASVCLHEPAQASHVGHHAHAHADAADVHDGGDDAGAGVQPDGSHADCHACHGCGTPLPVTANPTPAATAAQITPQHLSPHCLQRAPDNPLRPPLVVLRA